MPGSRKRSRVGPKRSYSRRLSRRPRRAAGRYSSKRLRTLSGKRALTGYATGGLVTRTGPAYLHAGEYVTNAATPHPFKTAVVNPFAVKGGCRIPDDTSYETFTITQTGSLNIHGQSLTNAANKTGYICGFRMRPSLADGSVFPGPSPGQYATTTCLADQLNPCINYKNASGSQIYVWQCGKYVPIATPGASGVVTYLWGQNAEGNADRSLQNYATSCVWDFADNTTNAIPKEPTQALTPVIGPLGYAVQQGSKCRPVAWGFRIRYAGLRNTTNNVNPYGRIYFGIITPESQGNMPGQGELDRNITFDGARTTTNQNANAGPGSPIQLEILRDLATRGQIGSITMDQLRSMPNGLILATGPRAQSERLFQDVDYASGVDRSVTVDTTGNEVLVSYESVSPASASYNITAHQISTVEGSQPWFLMEAGINVELLCEVIQHWEVVPAASAYTLPGTCKAEMANAAIIDSATNLMSVVATHPTVVLG